MPVAWPVGPGRPRVGFKLVQPPLPAPQRPKAVPAWQGIHSQRRRRHGGGTGCRGLARRLVGTALDWARRSGVRTVTLRMAPDNRVARSLYEGFGFTEVPGDAPGEVGMELSFS